jgi:hypothetical protein
VLNAVLIQLGERHSGLDNGVRELLVDFKDTIHAVQVECYAARETGCRTAVADVLAAREGPERNAVAIGDIEDRLDLFNACGPTYHMSMTGWIPRLLRSYTLLLH